MDSRKFSSNISILVESRWTPDGVHQIHLEYLESTWSMWSKVKYWDDGDGDDGNNKVLSCGIAR